jgi:hypothetical protein
MEKDELQQRLKRLYILAFILLMLILVNQYFSGGLFELVPPILATRTAGPTREYSGEETESYPVASREPVEEKVSASATPTIEEFYPVETQASTTQTPTPESYPVNPIEPEGTLFDSYPAGETSYP